MTKEETFLLRVGGYVDELLDKIEWASARNAGRPWQDAASASRKAVRETTP